MAESSRPFQGTSPGDAGPYSAQQWQTTWSNIVGFGASEPNRGVLLGTLDDLEVLATSPVSNQIEVSPGAALVQGLWYGSTATEAFTIQANGSGNPRIDLVVLTADYTAKTVRLEISQGTPAISPAIPTLTQSTQVLWQIPIARIAVAAGFVTITQADITDMREYANLPPVMAQAVINQAATVLEKGNVVIRDTSPTGTPMAVNTTTTPGDDLLLGVIETRVAASGGETRVITRGVTIVIVDENVAVGDLLTTSTTAGQAGIMEAGRTCLPFAVVLTAASAGDPALCYVDVPIKPRVLIPTGFRAYRDADQTVTANVTTLLNWNQVDFNDGGWFDTATDRFTPLEAGRYWVYVSATGQYTANNFIEIQQNGATAQRQEGTSTQGFGGWSVGTVLEFNGTTDYVEAYININNTNVVLATRVGQFGAYKIGELP